LPSPWSRSRPGANPPVRRTDPLVIPAQAGVQEVQHLAGCPLSRA
jgi:hypothetical protein